MQELKTAHFDLTNYLGNFGSKNEILFAFLFNGIFPSTYGFGPKFRGDLEKLKKFFFDSFELRIQDHDDFKIRNLFFFDKKNELLIQHSDDYNTNIYYNLKNKTSQKAAQKLVDFLVEKRLLIDHRVKEGDSSISILNKDEDFGGLKFQPIKIQTRRSDIDLNYTDDLKVKFEEIKRFLISDKQGIVLFSGEPATGKTSLLKELVAQLSEKVHFVYIPPDFLSTLTDPTFLTFLASQKQDKNTVFIIEDAEVALKSRELDESVGSSVSNLLNMADGFLGDILKIKFITTLNVSSKIDKALLRKGRLAVEHKFKPLPPEKANKLLEKLGKKHRTTVEMTVGECYNTDMENFHTEQKTETIGFKVK